MTVVHEEFAAHLYCIVHFLKRYSDDTVAVNSRSVAVVVVLKNVVEFMAHCMLLNDAAAHTVAPEERVFPYEYTSDNEMMYDLSEISTYTL